MEKTMEVNTWSYSVIFNETVIDYIKNIADQSLGNARESSETITALHAWWTAIIGDANVANNTILTNDLLPTISLLFDAELYALNNNMTSASYDALWKHFIENMEANPQLLNTFSRVFNSAYYQAQNPDVVNYYGNNPVKAFKHFLIFGMNEGRSSIAGWNVQSYRVNYSDLENAFGNDLKQYYIHFCVYGYNEGRSGV